MTPAAHRIYREALDRSHSQTDKMFAWLLMAQWAIAIALACIISPFSYDHGERTLHFHVIAAIGFGAVLNTGPLLLIRSRAGWVVTRHVVAVSQMLWSALFIMITNGRIETHFHVFGSLAFLAFYRDWKLLVTATLTVATEHLTRGMLWPDSVYGLANPEWWRFLEHATWVAFEDIVLIFGCARALRELRIACEQKAQIEQTKELVEQQVKERTAELETSMERYRSLVENTEAIPFEYDAHAFQVLYMAPQLSRIVEYPAEQLDAKVLTTVLHPDDRERVRATIRSFSDGTRSGEPFDFRLRSRSGKIYDVRCFLSDREGARVRGILLDMTKQKHLETELRQAQKLESVGRLAAGVAHEINTPIQFVSDSVSFARDAVADLVGIAGKLRAAADRVITGASAIELASEASAAAELADLPYLVEQLPKALDRALQGTDRVAAIVRSMKTFAHADRSEAAVVDLNDSVESTLTVASSEYKLVADLVLALDPTLPPVTCFVGEINQVLLNLVTNAAYAIGERNGNGAHARGTITVATRHGGGFVEISITDTGGGIPDAVREKIFDPFFTTKPVGTGTGQGLSTARTVVVDKHRGTLTFETQAGVGTTFRIRIPIDPASVEAAA
jgi:PAS domain S-box-containing protein